MSNDFEVSIEGDFIKQFGTMKKDLEKLTQRILRKTANQTDVEIHRVITSNQLMDIDIKDFRKTKTLVRHSDLKGGIDGMNITITVTSKAHTSYRFFPTYRVIGRGKYWVGKIHGKNTAFYGGQAFALPGKKPLFARESTDRFPIKPVFGPTASDLLERGNYTPKVVTFSESSLRANLLKGLGEDINI